MEKLGYDVSCCSLESFIEYCVEHVKDIIVVCSLFILPVRKETLHIGYL